MTLGDLSNLVLSLVQEPGASFTVGGGGGPTWGALSNPQFSQGFVEFTINEAYRKLLGDLEDLELLLVANVFSSSTQTYKYPFPLPGYAPASHVARVYYKPKGLPYTREFRPGTELVSWAEYQRFTGQGYLLPYAFGTQPWIASVDPQLANLYFYPGSASAGDTITVQYTPLPSLGATGCPTLVNATDVPLLPNDTHMAIFYGAMQMVWIKARQQQMAVQSIAQYKDEVASIRARYTKKHHGDTFRIEAFSDPLSLDSFGG